MTDGGEAGSRNQAGSSSGKAGSSPAGGSGSAGEGPLGGSGGSAPEPGSEGGSGGHDDGDGGMAGGGGQPAETHPAKLNGPDGLLVPAVSDLRGLTFSASGKIWASGHVGVSTTYPTGVDRQLAIVRFNADGTLDTTFDGDGIKTLNLRTRQGVDENITNDGDEQSLGIVELPSGDLVIQANVRDASGKGRDVVLLKMNAAGSLLNFGSGASAVTVRKIDFGWSDADNVDYPGAPAAQPSDESWGIALDPSGTKVVVFGHGPAKKGALTEGPSPEQRTDNDRYVVRVNVSDGLVDPTFNGGAPYTFNTAGTNPDNARRGIVEADGAIVSAGYTNMNGGNHIVVLRLDSSGVPDPNFAFGTPVIPGAAVSNPFAADGGMAEVYQVGKQSTGRYVTTGYGRATGENVTSTFDPPWLTTNAVDLVSFGLESGPGGGALDTSFGVAGTLAIQSEALNLGNTEDRGRDLVVLEDDRVVHVGRLGTSPAIFVTTADGELDPDAGGTGAGASGGDTIAGVFTYAPLSGATSHFFAVARSGSRIAATTNNHADGVILALLDLE
jgi:uncharacterized delta-60 repeat protein